MDAASSHLDPFRVRADEADQAVLDPGPESERLFAAHDVDGARRRRAGQARHDMAGAAFAEIDGDHGPRHVGRSGRTMRVRRFDPALAAADHADQRHRQVRLAPEPGPAEALEHARVLPLGEGRHALLGRDALRDRRALDEIGADPGRSPIDKNEAHRVHRMLARLSPPSPEGGGRRRSGRGGGDTGAE